MLSTVDNTNATACIRTYTIISRHNTQVVI